MPNPSINQRDVETDRIEKTGVIVKIGRSKWTVPTATIVSALLIAAGTAWKIVDNERQAIHAAIAANRAAAEARDEACLAKISEARSQAEQIGQKLGQQEVLLTEIRAGLSRLDARVAEVQVTLMRSPSRN
jgi:hypothetical protein